MRPILFAAILAIASPAFGQYCYQGKTYYYPSQTTYSYPVVAPAKVEAKVNVTVAQKDAYLSDEDLAGEVGRRVAKYEAGLRALGGAASYAQPYAQQYQAPAAQIAPQAAAVVPYQAGSTAYAIQSQVVDVFGTDAVDKVAKLLDGQQRIATQQADISRQISDGVNGQISALSDGIRLQQQANDAAKEIAAQTDAVAVMGQALIAMAKASKPEPRAHIETRGLAPQVVPAQPAALPPAETQGVQSVGPERSVLRVLNSACVKCHQGPEAKAGLVLDGSEQLDEAALRKVFSTIQTGRTPSGSVMPPEGSGLSLTLEQRTAALVEACRLAK